MAATERAPDPLGEEIPSIKVTPSEGGDVPEKASKNPIDGSAGGLLDEAAKASKNSGNEPVGAQLRAMGKTSEETLAGKLLDVPKDVTKAPASKTPGGVLPEVPKDVSTKVPKKAG